MAQKETLSSNKETKQVKSRQRVADHGEVFTNEREVNAMLDLVKHETERIESTFLEPACGNGNFLAEVLRRKLNEVDRRYSKSQLEWETNMLVAVSSIYGVDILEDNAEECRERLYQIIQDRYEINFSKNYRPECLQSIKYLLNKNILWGDALDFTNPETNAPIVFSEWKLVPSRMFKRRDFMFKFLVEQSFQYSMFNDEGEVGAIDEPVKEYAAQSIFSLSDSNAE